MAEEQRCEAQPEQLHHRLCANNCGFFGSPATLNLCSKCYKHHNLQQDQASSLKLAVQKSLAPEVRSPIVLVSAPSPLETPTPEGESSAAQEPAQASRCSTCRKRVGLTGFKCRCGLTCCGTHRYPEQHGCTFDFKGVGREAIAKANPIVKAEKLEKI